ncbi:MAG: peptidase M16 [Verrucomicrobiales bacterium]|nr:peptidase M16 [Verrucomicrobiales bacterium]
MKLRITLLLLAGVLTSPAQQLKVIEKYLPNGFKILMVERRDAPMVAGGWVAHVGSANERPGMTGIAHLFEHMLFKGTPVLGTKNYGKDLEIIEKQEEVREAMRQESAKMRDEFRRGLIKDPTKPENQSEKYRKLEKEFKKLVEEQREILVKNEFDRIYTGGGGSMMNAYTSMDMTAYFITVPANKLELWMWMESERILQPIFREFYAERDVVFEERRMRTESTPLGRLNESFWAMFWESHPYSWPTVGWPSDIPAITKAQADEFYATYYAPENITLILVGDFKWQDCFKLVNRYFSRIPKGTRKVPEVVTAEIKQVGEKRLYGEADANPQIDIMFHTPAFGHTDSYPLRVVSRLLSTRTGRLYKKLIDVEDKVATDTFAANYTLKYGGVFTIGGEAAEGKKPEDVEKAVLAELERLKEELVPARELQKVKNNFAASEYRKLAHSHAILHQLMRYEGSGRWQEFNEAGPKIQAVKPEDIQRVAKEYFKKTNRSVAIYTRKPGSKKDTEFAGLTSQQIPFVRQFVARLKQQKDVAGLKAQLGQMSAQLEKTDQKNQAMMKVIIKKIQERIAELESK